MACGPVASVHVTRRHTMPRRHSADGSHSILEVPTVSLSIVATEPWECCDGRLDGGRLTSARGRSQLGGRHIRLQRRAVGNASPCPLFTNTPLFGTCCSDGLRVPAMAPSAQDVRARDGNASQPQSSVPVGTAIPRRRCTSGRGRSFRVVLAASRLAYTQGSRCARSS